VPYAGDRRLSQKPTVPDYRQHSAAATAVRFVIY
jgi:hypothetical protein